MTKVEGCLKGKRVSEVCKNHKSVKKDKKNLCQEVDLQPQRGYFDSSHSPLACKMFNVL